MAFYWLLLSLLKNVENLPWKKKMVMQHQHFSFSGCFSYFLGGFWLEFSFWGKISHLASNFVGRETQIKRDAWLLLYMPEPLFYHHHVPLQLIQGHEYVRLDIIFLNKGSTKNKFQVLINVHGVHVLFVTTFSVTNIWNPIFYLH